MGFILCVTSKKIGEIRIALCAAVFLGSSSAAHAYVLCFWDRYLENLDRGVNPARWYEYAVFSSLMIVAIAVLFGCYVLMSLVLIGFSNASMNLFGLLMELMNPPDRLELNWLPFIFGCFAGVGPWVVVLSYFLGGGNYSDTPNFVHGILGGYFFFFCAFPVNNGASVRQSWALG